MNLSISILTWNCIQNIEMLIKSLVDDFNYLCEKHNISLNICDNGSTDGTVEFLKDCKLLPINLTLLEKNMGINISKNILIDQAIRQNTDFMFAFDHDLAIIKGSMPVMLDVIFQNESVGCFGQHIDFYRKDKNSDLIAIEFPNIDDLNIRHNIKSGCGAVRPWPHYSIYRTSMFRDGVRFDIEGPFSYPGYGFDDDDFGMQISEKGYDIWCFTELYCYHNINSSIPSLKKIGYSINYDKREKYFLNKWKKVLDNK